jgi:hypothetical protein
MLKVSGQSWGVGRVSDSQLTPLLVSQVSHESIAPQLQQPCSQPATQCRRANPFTSETQPPPLYVRTRVKVMVFLFLALAITTHTGTRACDPLQVFNVTVNETMEPRGSVTARAKRAGACVAKDDLTGQKHVHIMVDSTCELTHRLRMCLDRSIMVRSVWVTAKDYYPVGCCS